MSDRYGRMDVQRIEHDHGSRIEPPLSEQWSDLDKLEWLAGVVHADTGLDITVKPGALLLNDVPQASYYSINLRSSSHSAFTYGDAWVYMSGVITGHKAARRQEQR